MLKKGFFMTEKSKEDYKADYTKPALREQLKEEIKQGSKGGPPQQWSARKSQLLKKQYEAKGGDYLHKGHLTKDQKNLKEWSTQESGLKK